jgi:hypothetical protein
MIKFSRMTASLEYSAMLWMNIERCKRRATKALAADNT